MREVMDRMYMKEITICYGLTETSPVFTQTSADDDIEHKCETVGRKHPPVDVRVIDPADGRICGPGEPGELCCKGYNVMKATTRCPRPPPPPSTRTGGSTPATWPAAPPRATTRSPAASRT